MGSPLRSRPSGVPVGRGLLARVPGASLGLAFVGLALVPLWLQGFQVTEWTYALSFGIAATGLNLLIADAGLVSLGQNAFFAFGAFATAVLALHGFSYWECLPLVALMSLAVGWILGPPIVKLGHLNFALITVGIGFVAPTIATRLTSLTGGANGEALPSFAAPSWTGLASGTCLYYMGLIVLLLAVLLTIGIQRSQAGRALRAQRDFQVAAEAFGVQAFRLRSGVFALSVMLGGIGGWLWSIASAFVAPGSFDATISIALLAGIVVGGLGLPTTAIFAGIFVEFLPTLSANISPAFGGLAQGCIIVVFLIVARRGVLGALKTGYRRLIRRWEGGRTSEVGVELSPAATERISELDSDSNRDRADTRYRPVDNTGGALERPSGSASFSAAPDMTKLKKVPGR